MEEGPECCRRAERSLGPPSGAGDRPRTTAVDRPAFDSIRQGGPTRTSADVLVPRLAGFFPDHLIITECKKALHVTTVHPLHPNALCWLRADHHGKSLRPRRRRSSASCPASRLVIGFVALCQPRQRRCARHRRPADAPQASRDWRWCARRARRALGSQGARWHAAGAARDAGPQRRRLGRGWVRRRLRGMGRPLPATLAIRAPLRLADASPWPNARPGPTLAFVL